MTPQYATVVASLFLVTIRGGNARCDVPPDASGHVVIPEGTTAVASQAFTFCTTMVSISLPISGTLVDIGESAFRGSSLGSAVIPASVQTVGFEAFALCTNLSSVVFLGATTVLRASVSQGQQFSGCSRLGSVQLPSQLRRIPINSFNGCSRLPSVDLPDSVAIIDRYAFFECSNLSAISLPSGITFIGDTAFGRCRQLSTVSLPSGITTIPSFGFSESGLSHIFIPNSVRSIQTHAFNFCSQLTSVRLPVGPAVLTIDSQAFSDCISLGTINIPSSAVNENSVAVISTSFRNTSCPQNLFVPGATLCNCVSGTCGPTTAPSATPSNAPSNAPSAPTAVPTAGPTSSPTQVPTLVPTASTVAPSARPTAQPTASPSSQPTTAPSTSPTSAPSVLTVQVAGDDQGAGNNSVIFIAIAVALVACLMITAVLGLFWHRQAIGKAEQRGEQKGVEVARAAVIANGPPADAPSTESSAPGTSEEAYDEVMDAQHGISPTVTAQTTLDNHNYIGIQGDYDVPHFNSDVPPILALDSEQYVVSDAHGVTGI